MNTFSRARWDSAEAPSILHRLHVYIQSGSQFTHEDTPHPPPPYPWVVFTCQTVSHTSPLPERDEHVHQKCRQGTLITNEQSLESLGAGVRYLNNVTASIPSVLQHPYAWCLLPACHAATLHPSISPLVIESGAAEGCFYVKCTFTCPSSIFNSFFNIIYSMAECGMFFKLWGKMLAVSNFWSIYISAYDYFYFITYAR